MKMLKPVTDPHAGCVCCGCGEIIASMKTRIYGGFGGWTIERDGDLVYCPPPDSEWTEYPTLQKFENAARRSPKSDWRAVLMLPLREAVYQRQGRNRWVLVKTGLGFA